MILKIKRIHHFFWGNFPARAKQMPSKVLFVGNAAVRSLRAKILADNSKNHHPIETLFLLPTNKTFEGICLARAGKFLQKELWFIL